MSAPDVYDFMQWEDGQMTEAAEAAFFQRLVNNGQAWTLQGMYGRRAMALIEAGVITLDEQTYTDEPVIDRDPIYPYPEDN